MTISESGLHSDPHNDLYYELHQGSGPPLLLVHGFLSSRAQWLNNIESLKRVCSPVVIELYGHGRSPAPEDGDCYLPGNYLRQFEQIRNDLGVDQWFVCGYSLGAGLTVRYAIEFPQRIIAHIFTNSTSGFATKETTDRYQQDGESLVNSYQEGGLPMIEKIPVHPINARRLPGNIKKAILEDCALLNPSGVANTIIYTNGYASVRDSVSANSLPALLVCGEKEERFLPFRNFLQSSMPQLDIINIDAGHAVNAEKSDDFNEVVSHFISTHTV